MRATNAAAAAVTAEALSNARFDGLSNVTVVDATPAESVMRTSFEISYTAKAFDGYNSVDQAHTIQGFAGLDRTVLDFIVEREPHKLPSKIARLAADPIDAINRYFMALKRGYLVGNAYDVDGSK